MQSSCAVECAVVAERLLGSTVRIQWTNVACGLFSDAYIWLGEDICAVVNSTHVIEETLSDSSGEIWGILFGGSGTPRTIGCSAM